MLTRRELLSGLGGVVGGAAVVASPFLIGSNGQEPGLNATEENETEPLPVVERDDTYKNVDIDGGIGFKPVSKFVPSHPTKRVVADLYVDPIGDVNSGSHFVRMKNLATETIFGGDRVAFDSTTSNTHFGVIPEDCEGDTVAWEIDPRSTDKRFVVAARWQAEIDR